MVQQVVLHDCHQQKLPPGVVGKSRPTLVRCQEVPFSERPQPHLWVSQGGPASDLWKWAWALTSGGQLCLQTLGQSNG